MSDFSIVEQAVFTSARSARGAGYHLTACSPGVSENDRRELPAWCPSHEGLMPDIPEQRSVNFFTLSSGRLCISRTVQDGEDYSQRGAARLVTNILLLPRELLARFGMDPFAVLSAVELSGRLAPTGELSSPHLAPIPLIGRATPVNKQLLRQLVQEIGPAKIGFAIDSLLNTSPLALGGAVSTERLIMAIWQCLPVSCRDKFSFSTGLQYAPRRPFDVVALPSDRADRRRLVQRFQLNMLDLDACDAVRVAAGSWANHVATTLVRHGVAVFAEQLAEPRPDLLPQELPELAAKLAEAQDATSRRRATASPVLSGISQMKVAHAHAPHPRHQQTANGSEEPGLPSESLSLNVPSEMLEKLETLDDVLFDAIAGKPGSLEQLERLWREVRVELPQDLVEESREHYLIHAMQSWEHFVHEGRSPQKAMAALDVLAVICEHYNG